MGSSSRSGRPQAEVVDGDGPLVEQHRSAGVGDRLARPDPNPLRGGRGKDSPAGGAAPKVERAPCLRPKRTVPVIRPMTGRLAVPTCGHPGDDDTEPDDRQRHEAGRGVERVHRPRQGRSERSRRIVAGVAADETRPRRRRRGAAGRCSIVSSLAQEVGAVVPSPRSRTERRRSRAPCKAGRQAGEW